ncbi:MAG: CDP-diacylglycerol--serine O-phosphatidyltransferase [Bacteriovoracaceae bacterium]|nr:CDP-diacylglycerol--serine O-phosphatidyltransferase [Bacteriovoracaceae bacterium]
MSGPKKLAFFLPNSFTALNMGCGFVSILLSYQGKFYYGCMILLLGAIFDSVDGRVARMTGTQSQFGEQFDSLSDLISFGMAPAFLLYNRFLIDYGRIGIIIAFIYLLCGALRLARFNANISKVSASFFQGLPIPSGAICTVGLVLLSTEFESIINYAPFLMVYIVMIAVLMISNVPFNSFKDSDTIRKHKKAVLFFMFLVGASVLVYEQIMIFTLMNLYVVISLVYYLTHRKTMGDIFQWNESDVEDEEAPSI